MDDRVIKTRISNLSPRSYFVIDQNCSTVIENLATEQECKQWVIDNGDIDCPYTIGYSVTLLTQVTKRAKITLQ